MIKIALGYTFDKMESALNISEEHGFEKVVKRLKELKEYLDDACILTCSLDVLMCVFNYLQMVEGCPGRGNIVFLDDCTELYKIAATNTSKKVTTVHQAWMCLLHDLCDDITDLYRYGYTNEDEDVEFLRNILQFLAYTQFAVDKEDFENLI